MDDSDNPFVQHVSSSAPVQSDNDASKHLSSQLKALSDWANDVQTPLALKLSDHNERHKCIAVVRTFYDHVLQTFPFPSEYPWTAIHEKIALIEASFAVFSRVGAAFCVADDFATFAKSFWRRVLGICCVLEEWIDSQGVTSEEGCPSPRELYERGESACTELLRTWFDCMQTETSGARGWEVAKEIVEECLAVCNDLLSSAPESGSLCVCLFESPRLRSGEPNGTQEVNVEGIILRDRTRFPLLISSILKIVLEAILPVSLSDWFLAGVQRNVVDCSFQAFHHIVSPLCVTSNAKRVRALVRLTSAMVVTSSSLAQCGIAEAMRVYTLTQLLVEGPGDYANQEEVILQRVYSTELATAPLRSEIQTISTSLTTEHWGIEGNNLRVLAALYLKTVVSQLDKDLLEEVRSSLSRSTNAVHYYELLSAMEKALDGFHQQDVDMEADAPDILHGDKRAWRQGVKSVVQALVEPEKLSWMDDDDTLGDGPFVMRALADTENCFQKRTHLPASARIELSKQLARLPCALARHLGSPCPAMPSQTPIACIPTAMRVAMILLNGPEKEVTPMVAKSVYDALARAIRHHMSGFGPAMTDPVSDLAVKGMKNPDRSVRLSAGRCLAELIRILQDKGPQGAEHVDIIFNSVDSIIVRFADRIKETTLLTTGLIARQATSEILYRALLCLITHLGSNNPVIKGTAFMQLVSVVDRKAKSRFGLMKPYMDLIAVFIVDHLPAHPSLLGEFCSFLGASPADFFSATLDALVPHLFATCNGPALQLVADTRTCDVVHLFWDKQAKIMAHAYMTPIPGQRQKIINFILSFFKTPQGRPIATVEDLINSVIVDIVSELVMKMGDEDEAIVNAAMHGLTRIEDTMNNPTAQTQPRDAKRTAGAFLEIHILGVLTHMVEILEGTKEKRTLQEKKCVCRAVGNIVGQIGSPVSAIAPQIMAMLQTMLAMPELREQTLQSWNTFIRVLNPADITPYIGPTGAAFLTAWPTLSWHSKEIVKDCLHYLVIDAGQAMKPHLDELVDLSSIPELREIGQRLAMLRQEWTQEEILEKLLGRISSENFSVACRAMEELRAFLLENDETFIRDLTSGDFFHPLVGKVCSALMVASCRDGEGAEPLRSLAFHCIGILGAVDPYRFETDSSNGRIILVSNFQDQDDDEIIDFVIHLIRDVLASAYRSTSDMQYQRDLAYAIQELLRTCKFSASLVTPGTSGSVPKKALMRWDRLPKSIMETVTPLLTTHYKLVVHDMPHPTQRPIYHTVPTYREWLQAWMTSLIPEAMGSKAKKFFGVFYGVVRNRDVGVARHLLPHLVLHILISGTSDAVDDIRSELLAILTDQVDINSKSSVDKKELSAQTVFMVMDHINSWIRTVRQNITVQAGASKRAAKRALEDKPEPSREPEYLVRVDSVLSNIDQTLMATAAFQCKAYARALMCFEQQIIRIRSHLNEEEKLQEYYERLHEIYAQLDEPDGMQGVSTLILSPSLEHQIRQHESTGQWTSAQSCWEVNLQQNPDDLKSHLGLLRCLRHLGHYDTMRTHVEGLISRHPDWKSSLVGYQVESEYIVGTWEKVDALVQQTVIDSATILLGRILLAMRKGDQSAILSELSFARQSLGAPIMAVGAKGYSRCYDTIVDLHLVHELEVIYNQTMSCRPSQEYETTARFDQLQQWLSARQECTLPSVRTREPILSIRRTAFGLASAYHRRAKEAIGQSWLLSAKLARKAGYWQTAYSAILQAQHSTPVFTVIASAKLTKASGDSVRALQELDNYYHVTRAQPGDVIDLTGEATDTESKMLQAKAFVLRARWMNDSNRYDGRYLLGLFDEANSLADWESGQFHWGDCQDQCFKELSQESRDQYSERANAMNINTIRCFAKAIQLGCKYTYQTVPRLLTLWLDIGAQEPPREKDILRATKLVDRSFKGSSKYKWYTAFPQILSRVGHNNSVVWSILSKIISGVITAYPQQALWLFASVVHSRDPQRSHRGKGIHKILTDTLQETNNVHLINDYFDMGYRLLELCDRPLDKGGRAMSMKDFPMLRRLVPSPVLVPCQESLTASLPPSSLEDVKHRPFPIDVPTIGNFMEEIEVMRSLANPKKFVIVGSDGLKYRFLGKPKDDLRKDARLMDFNTIINKFLKSDSESRRRQLHIRTYCVIPLNEDCGLIQWVPNTKPLRQVLTAAYGRRGIQPYPSKLANIWSEMAAAIDVKEAARRFEEEVLPMFPPLFHEWLIETFPEPSAWLTSRVAYTRTTAVISMVGYILGLGDRHTENILLDVMTGDLIHVDFNCLFERGQKLQTPERVPFRLTQNIVDGFGVTGVEGAFRVACELSMQILRHNKDCLRTVLDAFIHDPLIEFVDEKDLLDKKSKDAAKKAAAQKTAAVMAGRARGAKGKEPEDAAEETNPQVRVDDLARDALQRISRKLQGLFVAYREPGSSMKSIPDKEVPTNSLVDMLIREATNNAHLAKMYAGWSPWH